MRKSMSPSWFLIKLVNGTRLYPDNNTPDWGYPKYSFVGLGRGIHKVAMSLPLAQ